jgi:hypothetical protein
MKYFGHETNSRRDPKIKKLVDRCGNEGKAVWWDLCEIAQETLGASIPFEDWGKVDPSHDAESLAIECNVTPDRLREILAVMDEIGLTYQSTDGRLYIPQVLKHVDHHYTTKLKAYLDKEKTDLYSMVQQNQANRNSSVTSRPAQGTRRPLKERKGNEISFTFHKKISDNQNSDGVGALNAPPPPKPVTSETPWVRSANEPRGEPVFIPKPRVKQASPFTDEEWDRLAACERRGKEGNMERDQIHRDAHIRFEKERLEEHGQG